MITPRPSSGHTHPKPGFPMTPFLGVEPVLYSEQVSRGILCVYVCVCVCMCVCMCVCVCVCEGQLLYIVTSTELGGIAFLKNQYNITVLLNTFHSTQYTLKTYDVHLCCATNWFPFSGMIITPQRKVKK